MTKFSCLVQSFVLTVIVLHNSLDAASRKFVASIPVGADVQIIDWYSNDAARYSYTGPPPSAFPTAVIDVPPHTEVVKDVKGNTIGTRNVPAMKATLRMPANWNAVQTALSSPLSARIESAATDGNYVGGQTLPEAQVLLNNPFLSPDAASAISNTLRKVAPAAQNTSVAP